jgi:hypothetical protein
MICGRTPWGRLIAWSFAVAGALIVGTQTIEADQPDGTPKDTTQFSGRVYAGLVGDETTPLEGVTVELYCSANRMVLGSLITATTTDPTGWYGLITEAFCEYYNIFEIDPPGFDSEGATSVGGEVIDSNWIEYASPIGGATLTGNKFWDRESDPPPGGWTGFWPTGWVNNRTVTCGIDVTDVGSGLDPSTAEYSFTSDGGASWSPWLPATCTGDPGSTEPETLTAHDVDFSSDTGIDQLTRILFRINDLDGHNGTSDEYPVEIDSIAPDSSVLGLDPCFGVPAFVVSWSGDPIDGSPIVSYDVWVEDRHDGTTVAEYEWQSGVTITTAEFIGEFGHDYSFSSRALDEAGNHEAYPPFPDTSTAIGCDLIVEVHDEGGALLPNAKVYLNGAYLGSTNGVGSIIAPQVMLGDDLLAIHKIHEEPSVKPHHGTLGNSNWAYKVYLTTFALAADGTPLLHVVSNLTTTQVLTVRPDQTLVGFHVLVSVEHDAKPAYMSTVRQRLEDASEFLYDVGDGQFFFDVIEIRDDSVFRAESDMKIYASNTGGAWAWYAAITSSTQKHIYGNRAIGAKTIIHEWGHYGLWLFDEYLNRAGKNTTDSYCSSNLMVPPVENRASIMHDQNKTSELCSRVDPSHTHRSNTQHDALSNGESTWETVDRKYTDTISTPPQWEILTPDERGARMPGPSTTPADLTTMIVVDADTGSCEPFTIKIRNSSGKPAVHAKVGLDRPPREWLYQGITNTAGKITILGAHVGERLWVSSSDGGYYSRTLTDCSGFTADLGYPANPFELEYEVGPLAQDVIEVRIRPEIPLADDPIANVWQEGVSAPIPIVLIWDPVPGAFVGQAGLVQEHEQAGTISIEATAADRSDTTTRRTNFRMHEVVAEQHTPRIYSAAGDFELVLPANALTDDAVLSIQTEAEVGPPPSGLSRFGPAYRVELSTGQQALLLPATITIRYDEILRNGAVEETLDIFLWNPAIEEWVSTDASVFPENTLATADITELHTAALMGRSAVLFIDDFESGTTTAWSITNP